MLKIAALVWMILGTAMAGIAIMIVLTVPSLNSSDMKLLPWAAVAGFVLAIPCALFISKRILSLTRPAH